MSSGENGIWDVYSIVHMGFGLRGNGRAATLREGAPVPFACFNLAKHTDRQISPQLTQSISDSSDIDCMSSYVCKDPYPHSPLRIEISLDCMNMLEQYACTLSSACIFP